METITIKKANALEALKQADSNLKPVLQALFGNDLVPQKITDRVKTFADVCDMLDVDPSFEIKLPDAMAGDLISMNAYGKLILIARALNEGWEPNWDNDKESKYRPYFNMSGSGLSFGAVADAYSTSTVGSRLCFKTRELCEYAAKQFVTEFSEFFIIQ